MKEIEIARTIVQKRRDKGITQDELAACMGVTKASVSKWETGTSYPDILLLPRLASYFNISIDELLDYSPQMTKEDISKLYLKFSKAFADHSFSKVKTECEEIIQKYYSCFPLLLQMAILYINHHMLAPDEKTAIATLEEAVKLCGRIRSEEENITLVKMAVSMEAIASLALGKTDQVFELLGEEISTVMSSETLIIRAHQMNGNIHKAKELSQVNLYIHLNEIFNMLPNYLQLYAEDIKRGEEIIERACGLIRLFEAENFNPNAVAIIYFQAAVFYIGNNQKEKFYNMLEAYVKVCSEKLRNITCHGDAFFDLLEEWMEEQGYGSQIPRTQKVINEDMLAGLSVTEAFAEIRKEDRFKRLYRQLEGQLKGNIN